jgi:hypothetical protein
MHLVLYQLDIDMYQSGEHMVNTEKKRNETWLLQNTVQSEKQG